MNSASRVAGSFRDPAGHIFRLDDKILRTVTLRAREQYDAALPVMRQLVADGLLVDFAEHAPERFGFSSNEIAVVLEHPPLENWTYPYEWSFSLLRDAALFHLDLHLRLLDQDLTLSDASAYNVQFVGPHPIFIDHLSIRPYVEGEFWLGHRQFCEQFLNPLLLRAYLDVAPNAWYRGNLEGISTTDFARIMPLRHKFSWRALSHVVLPAKFQSQATSEASAKDYLANRKLPKVGLVSMVRQLRNWIAGLRPANASATTWANYATTTTYSDKEQGSKREFVHNFVANAGIKTVIDLGCNTGDYSKVCLEAGANSVVGFDFDQQSIDKALARAKKEKLNFLPLFLDARNPSPNQGWMQSERLSFADRFQADGVIALAFEHHLAIAHNVPLPSMLDWITSFAPKSIIEYVPKSDPTIQKMLALREDVFLDYTQDKFEKHLRATGRIVSQNTIAESGRTLYHFER